MVEKYHTTSQPVQNLAFAGLDKKLAEAKPEIDEKKRSYRPKEYDRVEPVYLQKLFDKIQNYEAVGRVLRTSGVSISANLKHPEGAIATYEILAQLYLENEAYKSASKKFAIIVTLEGNAAQELHTVLKNSGIEHIFQQV